MKKNVLGDASPRNDVSPLASRRALLGLAAILGVFGCTPTVKVEAPDKPIEINLNVNIEHHVKLEIQEDVKKSIAKNKDIF